MAKIKMSPQILCEALKAYDCIKLTTTLCELLIPILPSESELTAVKGYDDPTQLADPDKFIFALGDIAGFDLRMKSMIFKANYLKSFEELEGKVERLKKIISFFRNDGRVLEWLKIVLAYGNYLNGTSNRYYISIF